MKLHCSYRGISKKEGTALSEVMVGGNVLLGGSSGPGFAHRVEDSAEDLSRSAEDRLVQGNVYL